MIREARIEDLPFVLLLGERFYYASHGDMDIPFDRNDTLEMLYSLMSEEEGILLVAESEDGRIVGFIGGTLYNWYFNSAYKCGQEMFWYVHPKYRGTTIGVRLLKELEQQAKDKGAHHFIMISEEGMGNGEFMEDLYNRMGYRTFETGYIKEL